MIDPDFEKRLENWGRVYGYSSRCSPLSNTAAICERMEIAAGRRGRDGYRELTARIETDEDDAATIEWCWARSDCRMQPKLRGLLKAHYVVRNDPRGTCRALGCRLTQYETMLAEAVVAFERVVTLLESANSYAA